jgi:pimeloyl-ACP methyl ester carboxylesterase
MRGSELHVVEEAAHIPMWETPEEVNEVILGFLKEVT